MFKKIILPVLLALLVIFGSAAGYYVWAKKNQVTIPFLEVEPEEAMDNMYEAMAEIKTMEYASDIQADAQINLRKLGMNSKKKIAQGILHLKDKQPRVLGVNNIKEEEALDKLAQADFPVGNISPGFGSPLSFLEKDNLGIGVHYNVSGAIDKNDAENIKGKTRMEADLSIDNTSLGLDLETVVNGKTVYYKLGGLPFPLSMLLAQLSAEFTGQWWKLDLEKLQEMQKEIAKNQGAEMPGLPDIAANQEKAEKIASGLREIAQKHDLITVDERLPDELLQDAQCYHYKVNLNKSSLSAFVQDFYNLVSREMEVENPMIMSGFADDPEFKQKIDKLSQAFKTASGEVWIDKKSFYLYKSKIDLDLDPSGIEIDGETMADGALSVTVQGQAEYEKINQAVDIRMPDESKDLNAFLEEKLKEERLKARDSKVISDVKQLQTALEMYYTEYGSYPETIQDNDNFFDYISEIPNHPGITGGECQGQESYVYESDDQGEFYTLEYCLAKGNSATQPGDNTATPYGISLEDMKSNNTDSDLDGLMDYEEIMVYQTDPRDDDTDGDGFEDGDEVKNGYNPAGEGELDISTSTPAGTSTTAPGSSPTID